MDLSIELARRFKTEAAAHADTVFRLATDRGTLLVFSVRAGEIEFEPDASPDVTFTFDRAETARAIILGDADPMDAFMAGGVRTTPDHAYNYAKGEAIRTRTWVSPK